MNDKTMKPKRLSGREVWKSKGGRGYFSKDYALSSTKGARLVLPRSGPSGWRSWSGPAAATAP